ncbi:selenoprotein S [Elysia marginata]|uniref:Selenoprotein S n=1 Tax=Elysia marginata TaxID=1093978 RepID=A0AAV4JH38_9GAST|nr:selenoprotein S [Elysia marginata]
MLERCDVIETRAPKTITYDVMTPIGSVSFTADDWLASPVSLSAILDFLRYGLCFAERARSAQNLICVEKPFSTTKRQTAEPKRSQEQTSTPSSTSTSSGKPKPKKTLRGDYNPLMGDASGGACYRPPRRGGGATGGG